MTKRTFLKAYFYVALVIFVGILAAAGWFSIAGEFGSMQWWEWFFIPGYALLFVALHGFVYSKPCLSVQFWKACFFVVLAFEIFGAFDLVGDVSGPAPAEFFVIFVLVQLVGYLFVAPLYFGAFLYSFKAKELWVANT